MVHTLASSFILGFHGCDRDVADNLLAGAEFNRSDNEYDWLGPGAYFWEANPKRGLEFAEKLSKLERGKHIKKPAVVGAIIDLGLCLDLTTSGGVEQVIAAHKELKAIVEEASSEEDGWVLPTNSEDLLQRNLDCAVIRTLHDIRKQNSLPQIDTVKGVFIEGCPVYLNSGFYSLTHIQICVCNLDSIKGVFRVPSRFLD